MIENFISLISMLKLNVWDGLHVQQMSLGVSEKIVFTKQDSQIPASKGSKALQTEDCCAGGLSILILSGTLIFFDSDTRHYDSLSHTTNITFLEDILAKPRLPLLRRSCRVLFKLISAVRQ